MKLKDKGMGFPTILKYLGGSPRRLGRAAGLVAGAGTGVEVEADGDVVHFSGFLGFADSLDFAGPVALGPVDGFGGE